MSRVLISIVLFLTLSVFTVFSEPCVETTSGRNGKCIGFMQCKEKLDLFKNKKIKPQICNRKLMTICCPEVSLITTKIEPPIRISQKKCEEYSTKINSTETYYNVLGQKITKIIDGCGHKYHDLTMGAPMARMYEFPHMALIGYGEGKFDDYKCAGSLISEQWVLSAAHCATIANLGDAKHIKLGGRKRLQLEPGTKIFSIVETIPHPSFTVSNNEHNIVLFKMNEPVTLDTFILPICLPQSNNLPTKKAIATGWGKIHDASEMSPVLLKINLDYFPIEKCQQFFEQDDKFNNMDFSNIICAGSETENYGLCQGDSGSSLQYFNRDYYCMYTISGILTDHGSAYCGSFADGAIYTSVFKYLDWIEGIVWYGEVVTENHYN